MGVNPRVSIIIPTYNRANFIKDAVDSVLSQSMQSFEVIVVDDGSRDDTANIINAIEDPRVIYVQFEKNMGRSFARNHALNIAKGEFIAFLDSDDLFLPGKLELQVDYLDKHPDVAMVYTHANTIDLIRNIKSEYLATQSGYIYDHITFFLPLTIVLSTVIVRKEVFDYVGNFDIHMNRFEDTDMWRRISKHFSIDAIPQYTCLIRTHDDNTLINQDPIVIVDSIKYYVNKIKIEDFVDATTFINGVKNLCRYYIEALNSVPDFKKYANDLKELLKKYKNKTTSSNENTIQSKHIALLTEHTALQTEHIALQERYQRLISFLPIKIGLILLKKFRRIKKLWV